MHAATITVNGAERAIEGEPTIVELLGQLGLHPRTVAVELNGSLVKRAELGQRRLAPGDRLELVRFVQGG